MVDYISKDKPPSIATPPRKTPSWRNRSCAALLGATTLVSLSLSGPATTPAVAQTPQKPNILFIMGDDIGWMQPRIYHEGLGLGETPKAMDALPMQSLKENLNLTRALGQ
jgi:arylsulfatase